MATQSLYRRYRPRRFAELKGQEHVFVMVLLTVIVLATAGTVLTFSHLLWAVSVCFQGFLGISLVRLLTVRTQLTYAVKFLAGCLVGFVVYSWIYQLLLYVVGNVWVTWSVVNLLTVTTALLIRKGIPLNSSSHEGFSQCLAMNDLRASIAIMLGGGLLIAGLSEMRSLIWIGVGFLLVEGLRADRASTVGKNWRLSLPIFFTTFVVSVLMAIKVDRPLGKFWFVSSNDLQTSVALAVSTSRFGFWNQSRYSGFTDTYHWGVYGWAGMTAPFGDYVVQVAVLAPIVVCGLLFGAGVICVGRITAVLRSGAAPRQIVLPVTAASIFIASGLSSYATQFGMLNVICFSLLLSGTSRANMRNHYLILLSLSLFAAVWANALGIVFLIMVITVNLVRKLILNRSQKNRSLSQDVSLSILMMLLVVGTWCLLYLPAARGGSFEFGLFSPRDFLFPNAALVLDFLNPQVRAILFEFLSTQSLLSVLMVVGIYWLTSEKTDWQPLQEVIVFGISSVAALLLLSGYEIRKFISWGTFATFILVGTLLAVLVCSVLNFDQQKRTPLITALAASGLVTFGSGLIAQLSPYFDLYFGKLELLKVVPIICIIFGLMFQLVIQRRPVTVLSIGAWVVVSMLGFQLGQFSVFYFMESQQKYELANSSSNSIYSLLMTDADVEAVANFVIENTSETSLIASNYFCMDGATCSSEKLLEVKQTELTPSIWGLQADMSNLAALTQRKFLIQAPRHVFGNYTMPPEAQRRFRLSGDYALAQSRRSELEEYGVDYFIVDWHSVILRPRVEILGTVYKNSRFSVVSFDFEP